MVDFSNIKTKMDDCLYSNILTAVNNWGYIDFEMIGADAWGFEFTEKKSPNDIELIWNRVHAYQNDSWKSIEMYYGVKITWNYTKTYDETFPIIRKELEENRPVLAYINSRYCPWHPRQNEDNIHFCLIVGIDKDNQSFHCVDISLNIQEAILPLNLFAQGCGSCITFSKSSAPCKSICWKEVVSNALERLGTGKLSSFNSMRRMSKELADEINNFLDIPKWIENPVPVVINVNLLQKGRIYFSIALKYLAERYDNQNLLVITSRLLQAAKKWNSISFMVYKVKSNQNDKNTLIKIPEKIYEIAKFEEEIASDLLYLLKS